MLLFSMRVSDNETVLLMVCWSETLSLVVHISPFAFLLTVDFLILNTIIYSNTY